MVFLACGKRNSLAFRVRVFFLALVTLLIATGNTLGFELHDLPRFQDRMVFYTRGAYAVGVSKAITRPAAEWGRIRRLTFNIYYVSATQYDRCFTLSFGKDTRVEQTDDAVVFSSDDGQLTLSAEGVTFAVNATYPDGKSAAMFCRVELDKIRFDDALAYYRQGQNITTHRVRPYGITPQKDDAVPAVALDYLSGADGLAPDYAIRTEEGLWSIWSFDLQTEGVERLYDSQGARLMSTGGGYSPAFYNTASTVAPGGTIRFRLAFRATPESGFPLPIPAAPATTMIDSHVHITATTDLRDSALMARKHGYRYGLLSILYREGDYGRHFMGDEHMFVTLKRYPDVFVGFGLVQLNERGFPGYSKRAPATPADVEQLWRSGSQGLKTLVKWSKHDVMVDDVKFDPLYAKAAEYGMPIVFHTEGEKYGSSHTRVAAAARRHPSVPMILAHLSSDQIEATVKELKRTPNLYIQHMHLEQKKDDQGRTALERLVEEGLADRIIFGSDVTNDHTGLSAETYRFHERLAALGVPPKTIDRILFETVEKILANVSKPTNTNPVR